MLRNITKSYIRTTANKGDRGLEVHKFTNCRRRYFDLVVPCCLGENSKNDESVGREILLALTFQLQPSEEKVTIFPDTDLKDFVLHPAALPPKLFGLRPGKLTFIRSLAQLALVTMFIQHFQNTTEYSAHLDLPFSMDVQLSTYLFYFKIMFVSTVSWLKFHTKNLQR